MFSKEIKFTASKEYIDCAEIFPQPSKLNIPDWYKELKHSVDNKTVKGCMPFLDTLTTGYIIRMPADYHIKHNIKIEGSRSTQGYTELHDLNNFLIRDTNVNRPHSIEAHPIEQLGKKCPFVDKNKSLPFHKLLNPWVIKTPPGYSCLFLPPMNNSDDRFSIIPGIVDTDNFDHEINFPIIINGDKYPVLETIIELGTPIAQVIPFKRDNWKMVIEAEPLIKKEKRRFNQVLKIFNVYKNRWWNKKSWK
tara:strand:+ start:2232 stop:2978 length:747 start_codon:yes stop_codon:yes gene_type:complete